MADGFGQQPQFDTAEFQSSGNACAFCKTALSAGYYRIQGKLTCANCYQKLQRSLPQDSHAAFSRAVIFGVGGALVGMALYAGVVYATHWTIGYLALAVGYIVAKAMMMGSENVGGRRYQVVAALLTYAAISVSEAVIYVLHRGFPKENQVAAVINLVIYGLLSPFFDFAGRPVNGILGLIILFVGLSIAWRMTAGTPKLKIEGPY